MKIAEILLIIVNISVCMLPVVMLIENFIKRRYNILNICIILNLFAWIYLSYLRNIKNPGFRVKCDVRILTLIACIIFIASIITFVIQFIKKKNNKWLILIAIIFVFYIIMTNDASYPERTLVENISDKEFREYILQQHVIYLAFLSMEVELMMNLLGTQKKSEEIEEKS